MMKRADRDKWVAALRSGKYQQGQNSLCHRKKYCCLGVLAEVVGPGLVPISFGTQSYGVRDELTHGTFRTTMWGERSGEPLDEETVLTLISMNDGRGVLPASFEEIAYWIEANIPVED